MDRQAVGRRERRLYTQGQSSMNLLSLSPVLLPQPSTYVHRAGSPAMGNYILMHMRVLLGHYASQTAEFAFDPLASAVSRCLPSRSPGTREERGEEIKESLICRDGCSAGEHRWALRRSPNHQWLPDSLSLLFFVISLSEAFWQTPGGRAGG